MKGAVMEKLDQVKIKTEPARNIPGYTAPAQSGVSKVEATKSEVIKSKGTKGGISKSGTVKGEHPSAYYRSFAKKPLVMGVGCHVDPLSFEPVINDPKAFAKKYGKLPEYAAISALWSGKPQEAKAEVAKLRAVDSENLSYIALEADVLRDLGEIDAAISKYQKLLEIARGSAKESEFWGRLGVVFFKGKLYAEAQNVFAKAYEKRILDGSSMEEVEATMRCLVRTQELLKAQSY